MTDQKLEKSDKKKPLSMEDMICGRIELPPASLVFGPPAIGKTSFASQAPGAFFLVTHTSDRSGTNEFDLKRFMIGHCKRASKTASCQGVCGWERTMEAIDFLSTHPACRTIVLDHMGGLEKVLVSHLLAIDPKGKRNMTEAHGGYQKAWDVAVMELGKLIERFDVARNNGKEIILIAHSFVKKVRDPELDQWEQHQIDLNEKLAIELRKWLDVVMYCNFDRHTYEEDGRKKAISTGLRLLHTRPPNSMAYFAKDRFSLPETIELSYAAFRKAYEQRPTVESVRGEIESQIGKLPVDKRVTALEYSQRTADVRTLLKFRDHLAKLIEASQDVTKEEVSTTSSGGTNVVTMTQQQAEA